MFGALEILMSYGYIYGYSFQVGDKELIFADFSEEYRTVRKHIEKWLAGRELTARKPQKMLDDEIERLFSQFFSQKKLEFDLKERAVREAQSDMEKAQRSEMLALAQEEAKKEVLLQAAVEGKPTPIDYLAETVVNDAVPEIPDAN